MSEFKQEHMLPDGTAITVIVMDQDVFDVCIDGLAAQLALSESPMSDEAVRKLKSLGQLPIIGRGTRTEWLFERFGVGGSVMGLIVRGVGRKLLRDAVLRN